MDSREVTEAYSPPGGAFSDKISNNPLDIWGDVSIILTGILAHKW